MLLMSLNWYVKFHWQTKKMLQLKQPTGFFETLFSTPLHWLNLLCSPSPGQPGLSVCNTHNHIRTMHTYWQVNFITYLTASFNVPSDFFSDSCWIECKCGHDKPISDFNTCSVSCINSSVGIGPIPTELLMQLSWLSLNHLHHPNISTWWTRIQIRLHYSIFTCKQCLESTTVIIPAITE